MRQPKRSDDKYWTGTRIFHEEQFISDLQDHIDDLNERNQALSIADVVKSLPNDDEIEQAANEESTKIFYGTGNGSEWYARHHGFVDGVEWLKNHLTK